MKSFVNALGRGLQTAAEVGAAAVGACTGTVSGLTIAGVAKATSGQGAMAEIGLVGVAAHQAAKTQVLERVAGGDPSDALQRRLQAFAERRMALRAGPGEPTPELT